MPAAAPVTPLPSPQEGLRASLLTFSRGENPPLLSLPDAALVWDQTGTLTYVGPWAGRPAAVRKWNDLRGYLLTPGFIDVHSHLPQYPAVGSGGLPLLPWLERYIFPLERRFTPAVAARQAPAFFSTLARHGISSAAVYTTADAQSTEVCFQAAEASGLRIVMGHMMMDRAAGSLVPPRAGGLSRILDANGKLCRKWHGKNEGKLRYAFSPRFAITCTEKLMREAGRLAQESGAFLQTHLSENREELAVVQSLFPHSRDYTDVYDRCGLLGSRTILGHAIYLSARERRILAARGAKIAHCPSSNLFLRSGIMDWRAIHQAGIEFGLASDVAGGPEVNPWEVMKAAAYSHHMGRLYLKGGQAAEPDEVFRWATVGGAAVLQQADRIGRLAPGYAADIASWEISAAFPDGAPPPDFNDPVALLARLMFRGQTLRARALWVAGETVWKAT